MLQTQEKLLELLRVLPAKRDEVWEKTFLQMLAYARLRVLHPEPRTGPDAWPYLFVEISQDSDEPAPRIIEWLSERGIGLAINPQKSIPDFVLSYGMLWNYRVRGEFLTVHVDSGAKEILAKNNRVYVAEPTESYLPQYARQILRQFFQDQKILKPRITLISEDGQNFDLAFSLESLHNPPVHEHLGISEAISWFLPAHYAIALVSETRISGFIDL